MSYCIECGAEHDAKVPELIADELAYCPDCNRHTAKANEVKLEARSGEPVPQRRFDDSRAGMSGVEIHISGTAERLDLVNAQAARLEELETLLKKYIVHVGECEGIDFIEPEYRGPAPERFTADEYEKLKAIAKAAWAEHHGQAELGL